MSDYEYEYDDDDNISDVEDYDYDEDHVEGKTSSDPPEKDVEFTILTSEDIRRRVDAATAEISGLLSISPPEAVVLLSKYGWNPSKIHEEWFSDEAKTRQSCGLVFSDPHKVIENEFFCGVCLDNYNGVADDNLGIMSSCGHVFCETCWMGYITATIDSAACLRLHCPHHKCTASAAGIIAVFSEKDEAIRAKYDNHVLRSYVESRKSMKWCPSPGCEFVLECQFRQVGVTNAHLDVSCKCSNGFCWNCSEERHSPADCALVGKWNTKNNSESENTNWIIVNTKPCPKCGRSIEKNGGCMHMTCNAGCGFNFCWICLKPYSGHICNRYKEDDNNVGSKSTANEIRERAKNDLNKYIHYHDRWTENDKSWKKATESMKEFSDKHINTLSDSNLLTENQLNTTIGDAWIQVIECRRVLKWSYALGYYFPENQKAKKQFFEFVQGQAEEKLEALHHLVEIDGSRHIQGAEDNLRKRAKKDDGVFLADEVVARDEFRGFLARVFELTKVTRKFFDDLVKALANNLPDVEDPELLKRAMNRSDLEFNPEQVMKALDVKDDQAEQVDDIYNCPAQMMYYLEELQEQFGDDNGV